MHAPGTVVTGDGGRLGYVGIGEGDPLVLVHGGGTDHRCWTSVVPLLADRFRVVAYDRRGRGLSRDTPADFSLGREAADLLDVLDAVSPDAPARVLAYSYGATATLEALATAPHRFRAVALYEPPTGRPAVLPPGLEHELRALLDAGDVRGAARLFVGRTFFLPERLLDRFEEGPLWAVLLETVGTLPAEVDAIERSAVDPARYRSCTTPVRCVVEREAGNPGFREIAHAVADAFPDADVAYVEGVPHFVFMSDPEGFLAAVGDVLSR